MTLQEFKAWFSGFTEEMSGAPSKKQWERIQARVKEIDGTAVTYPVFIERYWAPAHPHWNTVSMPCWQGIGVGYNAPNMNTLIDGHTVYNSAQAMLALGKADYQANN